jgi:hypothetical protein
VGRVLFGVGVMLQGGSYRVGCDCGGPIEPRPDAGGDTGLDASTPTGGGDGGADLDAGGDAGLDGSTPIDGGDRGADLDAGLAKLTWDCCRRPPTWPSP